MSRVMQKSALCDMQYAASGQGNCTTDKVAPDQTAKKRHKIHYRMTRLISC